jgi:hypothetical protein
MTGVIEIVGRVPLTQSGIGLPHSKTLAHSLARHSNREVLECGRPMPLSPEIVRTVRRLELHQVVTA